MIDNLAAAEMTCLQNQPAITGNPAVTGRWASWRGTAMAIAGYSWLLQAERAH